MESFAVIRADDQTKLNTAISDLQRHGGLTFAIAPKELKPASADKILVNVMKVPLKKSCRAAALVSLNDDPGVAIDVLGRIHPPAHVIIVSSRHDVYSKITDCITRLPDLKDYVAPVIQKKVQ
ncbi:DUF356 domain-containing protein [Methanocella arvoryzae]|uniref:DUF356 domain-containing protein n=1 Tax=Methanocella arvoryzae (strain DSM 22066 / NBRC 105507 / MRE50) TaxID=351160 RepID=Q0W258_METAR|nr:DUF356 domain-containing protein [Methanocella arvoryzae]CAJ37535.1 conserved hypothetical protein [Methanocella arvoryzae MRE50]